MTKEQETFQGIDVQFSIKGDRYRLYAILSPIQYVIAELKVSEEGNTYEKNPQYFDTLHGALQRINALHIAYLSAKSFKELFHKLFALHAEGLAFLQTLTFTVPKEVKKNEHKKQKRTTDTQTKTRRKTRVAEQTREDNAQTSTKRRKRSTAEAPKVSSTQVDTPVRHRRLRAGL